ncbi:MAG: alanine racemase [Bacteroidia bacterium]
MVWEDLYLRYSTALRNLPRPLAFVDLEALEENAQRVLKYAGKLPVRLATKSIRCAAILRHILEISPRFQGLFCMSAREALYLAKEGFDDFLIGYPFYQPAEQSAYLALLELGKRAIALIDSLAQAEALNYTLRGTPFSASVCLEVDMASDWGWLYFGVRRSPLYTVEAVLHLAHQLRHLGKLELVGLVAYEAQIAGVGDKNVGWQGPIVRFLKRRSWQEVQARRAEVVQALRTAGFALSIVNGGGTGSLPETATDPSVTELTAGSAFFAPALFDHYQQVTFVPAAGFSLEIVRQPTPTIFTCHGGGYIASGAIGPQKQPRPWLPPHAKFLPHEGAGEIQTPLQIVPTPAFLKVGEPLYFRHAKAGELTQHFPTLHALRGEKVVAHFPTYAALPEVWV